MGGWDLWNSTKVVQPGTQEWDDLVRRMREASKLEDMTPPLPLPDNSSEDVKEHE